RRRFARSPRGPPRCGSSRARRGHARPSVRRIAGPDSRRRRSVSAPRRAILRRDCPSPMIAAGADEALAYAQLPPTPDDRTRLRMDQPDTPVTDDVVTMDKIVALCKRRGFIFPSSEIYGGVGSTYDYGHYGVLLKTNVKGEWWRAMLQERDDIVALDSAIIQPPDVWKASGHLAGFTDPLVDCRTCKKRFRADHLDQLECGQKPSKHPGEGPDCD